MVNVLILCCLPIIGKFQYVPTAVICDGLFLFMGISGLSGNQLFERLKLMITDPDLYPELPFSEEEVPRKQMHVFTLFQLMVVVVLFAVAKSPIALAFPVFLVSSIPLRASIHKISGGFVTKDMVQILDFAKKPARNYGDRAKVAVTVEDKVKGDMSTKVPPAPAVDDTHKSEEV